MATLEERIAALELKLGTLTPRRFPQGVDQVAVLNLLDKVLVGVNADGSAKVAAVNQIANLISATVGSGIEPTVEPDTTLPAPAQPGKIMIMKGGIYTQPGGGNLSAPANSFNVGYWDGEEWSVDISIETEADLSGYATTAAVDGVGETLNKIITYGPDMESLSFPAEGPGIWAGDIGGGVTLSGSSSWTASRRIHVLGGSTVSLRTYSATSSAQILVIALDVDDTIVAKFTSGSNFATGSFDYTLPANASYVLLNILNTGVSAAIVQIVKPQIAKPSLSEVYSSIDTLADFRKTRTTFYPIGGTGIWAGDVGSTASIVPGGSWRYSKRITAYPGEVLLLLDYFTVSAANITVLVMSSDNIILARLEAGTNYDGGVLRYTMPEGTSYVLLNVNATSDIYPPSSAVVIINPPHLRREMMPDLYQMLGIKYTALGDSITALSQGNTYASRIAAWIRAREYVNYAIGGATWAYRTGTPATDDPQPTDSSNVVPNQVRKMITAFNNDVIEAPDLITIAAGINDAVRGHALGDILTEFDKPLNEVNMQTIVGAVRWTISTLMEQFPDVRIVILTPLLTSVPARNYEVTLPYANKLKEVAGRLAVPVIDCFGESLINEVNQARYMQTDMLHPNTLGQQMQALYVYRRLKNIYYNL